MSANDDDVIDADWYECPAPFSSQPPPKKPMSGWRRLWIVISLVFGIPAAAIAWDANDSGYTYVRPDTQVAALTGQKFWDALWEQAKREKDEELGACIVRTVQMHRAYDGEYTISCERAGYYPLSYALLWGCMPGFAMWIAGKIIRWVYRGFRPVTA